VIILIIQDVRVPVTKLERHSPIPANSDRPPSRSPTLEGVEPKAREIHVRNLLSGVKGGQLDTKPPSVRRLHPRCLSCFKKRAQALVLKGLDHRVTIAWCATRNSSARIERNSYALRSTHSTSSSFAMSAARRSKVANPHPMWPAIRMRCASVTWALPTLSRSMTS
jgi:hypothetical protein